MAQAKMNKYLRTINKIKFKNNKMKNINKLNNNRINC